MAKALNECDWSIWNDISNVQTAADVFYEFIGNIYNISFPTKMEKQKLKAYSWINNKIIKLIKEKDNYYVTLGQDSLKYQLLCTDVKNEIKKEKKKVSGNLNMAYKTSPTGYYDYLKGMLGSGNDNGEKKPVLLSNMDWSESNRWMVSYFESILNSHPPLPMDGIPDIDSKCTLPLMEVYEVYTALSKLSKRSSPAPGEIPPAIYKEFSLFLAEPITTLINKSIIQGFCPTQWKVNYLIPIPKVNKPQTPDQIRPIAISSPLVKIAERHIIRHLRSQIINRLDPWQFGGIPGRSTCHYLVFYIQRVLAHLEKRGAVVDSVMTDFAKAFDNVDHDLLVSKLKGLHVDNSTIVWITSFLSDRTLLLKNLEHKGDVIRCSNGIPQGSVLGGFLFTIYVNDLMVGYDNRLKYMDDLSVSVMSFANQKNCIQEVVEEISKQALTLSIPLNLNKCVILSHSFVRNPNVSNVILEDSVLKQVKYVKLLGVYIQEDLKWENQVEQMIGKANGRMHLLYKLRRLGVSKEVMVNAYVAFIRPLLEYCAPVWHRSLTLSQSSDIESIQKRVSRIIMANDKGYDSNVSLLNIPKLYDRRDQLHKTFAIDFFKKYPTLLPQTRGQATGINIRKANRLTKPRVKTKRFQLAPICTFIDTVNHTL